MDKRSQEIVQLYKAVESIIDEQISISQSAEDFERQYTLVLSKDELKQKYIDDISKLSVITIDYIKQDERLTAELQDRIQSIQDKTNHLTLLITSLYEQASKSMKQVNTHLKTLHSYGGINNSDSIPYYFDVKK